MLCALPKHRLSESGTNPSSQRRCEGSQIGNVGFGAKCVRDAFLFSTATRPAPGGHLGLLGAAHLELRRSMRKLATLCRLAARLCPASRPPLMRCHAVTHKQKEGKVYFLASLHFSFLSTTLQYILLVFLTFS